MIKTIYDRDGIKIQRNTTGFIVTKDGHIQIRAEKRQISITKNLLKKAKEIL